MAVTSLSQALVKGVQFLFKKSYRKVIDNLKRDKSNEMLKVIVLGAIKIHVNKS